jgi:anaerobic ribonucleoside-triphosphate reductase
MNKETKFKKVPVECYSRVVGYFRPIQQWNDGKQEEFRQRKTMSNKNLNNHRSLK